jgi:hypothetical protein
MKISIGFVNDRNIWDIIETNVENGMAVYSDGKEYYVDVLNEPNVYRADDAQFQHIPSGMYKIKNNIVYTVDDVQTWINL